MDGNPVSNDNIPPQVERPADIDNPTNRFYFPSIERIANGSSDAA